MKKDKKGIEPIVTTVLLILLAVIGGGAVAYYTIPLVNNVDASCLDALQAVDFEDTGVTCNIVGNEPLSAFSVRISSVDLEGFDLGFKNDGKADTYAIKEGSSYEDVCLLDSQFGEPLEVPNKQEVRTYVTKGNPQEIYISPILASGKSCYSEGRKNIEIKTKCVDPNIKSRLNNCLSATSELCGNGVTDVDEGETCDDGSQNGVACTAQYGNSCNYCGSNCNTATIQGPYCGDGICQAGYENYLTCGDCANSCILDSAYWSVTDAIESQQVNLIVNGTGCEGQTLNWTIFEDDGIFGTDSVSINPSPVMFSSGQAIGSWIAEWQSDWPFNPPEYYFSARVVSNNELIESSKLDADELKVTPSSSSCGNGVINNGETCDDGNTLSGDGCSNTCQIENGWNCNSEPSACTCTLDSDGDGVCDNIDNCPNNYNPGQEDSDFDHIGDACETSTCGNQIIEPGEECDGYNLNPLGNQCTSYGHVPSFHGGTVYCKLDCTIDFQGCEYCGDGIINGPEQCDLSALPNGASCTNYPHNPLYTGGDVFCGVSCNINFGQCTTGTGGSGQGNNSGGGAGA